MRLRSFVPIAALAAFSAVGVAGASHVPQLDPGSVPVGFLVTHNHVADVPSEPLRRIADAPGGADVFVQHFQVPANTALPFHTHPGPVIVTVVSGALTYEDACITVTYEAGSGFVDEGFGHVHRAIAGPEGAHFYATYLLPHGSPSHVTPVPEGPGPCPDNGDGDGENGDGDQVLDDQDHDGPQEADDFDEE
jgi:quercetin dioxygenase-like cupin family protein